MNPSKDFYEGLGYLAYAFSIADGHADADEARKFGSGMLNAFGRWSADTKSARGAAAYDIARADGLNSDQAYSKAVEVFAFARPELKHFRDKIVQIVTEISASDRDFSDAEQTLLERFKTDTASL